MKEAIVLLNIKGKMNEDFLEDLQKQFPQIIEFKMAQGPYNIHLHLKSGTLEELKETFCEINPQLDAFQVTDELIIADSR
ncbi:MAG: hypothetical protein ACFFD4_31600 [Candidatus Odinarchaeota archaeon]